MISRILYRESVQGVLKYILGKEGRAILGFQNTYSEQDTDIHLFGNILYGLGQLKSSSKRYAHITLNLPHDEQMDDMTFYAMAKEYMDQMGYSKQPYIVVRHNDTKHQHVHIVSTTIMDDGGSINLSNDYKRNMAIQKYLEKKFGLSPSPETRLERQLPIHRLPEQQFSMDDSHGNRFYIQDVLNSTLQKYKVRSFKELKTLVKPYHIVIKKTKNENGRVGVSYGLNNQKQYKTRFIDGYKVHPQLSGPKLEQVFKASRKSKLIPMHRKRLEKQLNTAFNLFENIRLEDLPEILRTYQNLDSELYLDKRGQLSSLVIFDKSGYVFYGSELGLLTHLADHPKLSDSTGQTKIDTREEQFYLELGKLVKKAYYQSYLTNNKGNLLLSEYIMSKGIRDILPLIASSPLYPFLNYYSDRENNQLLPKMLLQVFEGIRNKLHNSEARKEKRGLRNRSILIGKVLDGPVFDTNNGPEIAYFLLRGLGLKYSNGIVSYMNSNIHKIPLELGNLKLPNTNLPNLSNCVIDQNEKVLQLLTGETDNKNIKLNPSSFFLPLILPELYNAMSEQYLKKFEELSLKVYHQKSERFNMPFEKSPEDYINLFNAKGFYFETVNNRIHIGWKYSKSSTTIPLPPKTQAYLNAIQNLDSLFREQQNTIGRAQDKAQEQLKNLWVSDLIERQLYHKAAYMMVYEDVRPILHIEALEHHMERGLRQKMLEVSDRKINAQQVRVLRNSIYAFSSLIGGSGYKEGEDYNGFKDEFTDCSKYISVFF